MKKILLILTNIVTPGFGNILKSRGYDVVEYKMTNEDYNKGAEELDKVLDASFYAVFMYDYIPQFAEVCWNRKILYICWIVDSPCFSLYSNTVAYETNRIFTFEKKQLAFIKEQYGIDAVYQPLGTDIVQFDRSINKNSRNSTFACDVSFVGNLYNSEDRNLYLAVKYLPEYIRGYFSGLIAFQSNMENNIISSEIITRDIENELRKYIVFDVNNYNFKYTDKIIDMLQKEATRVERCKAVSILNRLFDFKLYTGSDTTFDVAIKNEKYLDYNRKMPIVFNCSKININITLKSIETAIPLRALDIMACGGFLLSDYQEDLEEYYDDGIECAMYYSLEEMIEKADFYLRNDDLRKKIAIAGYEKTKQLFSLEKQLGALCNKLETW